MEYNDVIARFTNQEKIYQEIQYTIHRENYAVFELIGESGTGKKTLSEVIAKEWIHQYKGKVFYLNATYQENPEDYSTFKALICKNNSNQRSFLNIFKESVKDIPFVGNSLSAITSEIIDNKFQEEDIINTFTQREQYIILKLHEHCSNSNVLYICNDIESWDLKSKHVLSTFIKYEKENHIDNKIFFIINTVHKLSILSGNTIIQKYLHKIKFDSLSQVISQFGTDVCLNNEQLEKIYELTDGNLELIKESIDLFDADTISIGNSFYEIIVSRLKSMANEEGENILKLLKETAFIGETVDNRLLKLFLDMDIEIYEEILQQAIALSYLKQTEHTVSFTKQYIYYILQKILYKDRRYYIRLIKCINILYPSRYDLQMHYLYRGSLTYEADKFFFIYLLSYYRENSLEYELSNDDKKRLASNRIYPFYLKMCEAYKLYKKKKYTEAEKILNSLYIEDIAFRFEKDYLLALIVTNKYNTLEEFSERIDVLSIYTDKQFKELYPEMYLRALMILVEFYAEADYEIELKETLSEIIRYFSRYSSTDKQIQCYEHCFKMKSNAFYKIEIAEKQTQIAYDYFSKNENMQNYLSKYFLAVLNHSANKTVLGEFQDAYNMLTKAYDAIKHYSHLKDLHKDIFLNNLSICGFYCQKYTAIECAEAIEKILLNIKNQADVTLLVNNQAVFLALSGNFEKAIEIFANLYNTIWYNEDIDEYYRYYILNNYGILLWIMNQSEEALRILNYISTLNPLPKDQSYFKARTNLLKKFICKENAVQIIQLPNWNGHLYTQNPHIIGKAWKFWSTLLLLSELQIWSDY